ncbi:MAG: serine protease [Planctomycetota bacterium]|nr:serine protease [Planctomycetota bacterium]
MRAPRRSLPARPWRLALLVAGLLCAFGARVAPVGAAPVQLEDGVARMVALPKGGLWAGRVDVPADATALTILVCSRVQTGLYLRHGQPLAAAPEALGEVSRVGGGALQVARLTASTPVPLREGIWHFAVVADPDTRGEPFEVVAFVDRGRGVPTIVPGAAPVTLAVHRDRPELRTFVPALAREVTLALEGANRPGVRYRLDGPQDYRRSGPAASTVVLTAPEAPSGAYTLDLSSARRGSLPPSVRVRATWTSTLEKTPSSEPQPIVQPGSVHTLTLGGAGPSARTVRIPVPADTGGIEIEARTPNGADVDLYVRRGGPLEQGDEDADYFALSSAGVERLYMGGLSGLTAGMYWCETVLVEGKGPVQVSLRVRRFPRGARRGTWGVQDPPPLVAGRWVRGRVGASGGGVTWYALDVPAGTTSFHAMLLESSAPLDLVFARRTDGSIMRRALSARVDERIDHVFRRAPDSKRLFLLGVMNRNALETVVDYRVAFSLNRPPEPPEGMAWPPLLNWQGRSPVVRAAAATVELTVADNAGGSGTCVTPRGRILTCRHVLELDGSDGKIQREKILVAFPGTLDRPPVQSFYARVTYDDASKDLALLEITTDVFGRPLPKDLTLPWLPLGDSSALELGDAVMVFGYPSQGSERSRTPVILTRGSIAGLESIGGAPRWLKTDAWIGLGHSGGSLVDSGMRLVGIPAATLGRRQVLGLAVPTSLIPAQWRLRILKDQPR